VYDFGFCDALKMQISTLKPKTGFALPKSGPAGMIMNGQVCSRREHYLGVNEHYLGVNLLSRIHLSICLIIRNHADNDVYFVDHHFIAFFASI
jgi:hypothetical protein